MYQINRMGRSAKRSAMPFRSRGGRGWAVARDAIVLVNSLYTRVVPSHAVELTSGALDRRVAGTPAPEGIASARLSRSKTLAAGHPPMWRDSRRRLRQAWLPVERGPALRRATTSRLSRAESTRCSASSRRFAGRRLTTDRLTSVRVAIPGLHAHVAAQYLLILAVSGGL